VVESKNIVTFSNGSNIKGKKVWSYTTVKSMLQNEKYKGDALLRKWSGYRNIIWLFSVESHIGFMV